MALPRKHKSQIPASHMRLGFVAQNVEDALSKLEIAEKKLNSVELSTLSTRKGYSLKLKALKRSRNLQVFSQDKARSI